MAMMMMMMPPPPPYRGCGACVVIGDWGGGGGEKVACGPPHTPGGEPQVPLQRRRAREQLPLQAVTRQTQHQP
jgi:hypothetical protein